MNEQDDEITICSGCHCKMDISLFAPFTNTECPECGTQTRVKCELDQYILLRRQGMGGMSLVFAAKDKNLGREVAIKILNEDYSMDSTRITQFEQEAMITAGISHPHVVRVYTVGKAFNRYYIAMELVSGKSLEQLMAEQGAISETEIIPKMLQVVEGLNAAHKAGLIHRDIKPGNILIDQLNMSKIVDFGLALVTQGGVATAEEIWATPYYVPPEALDGQPEDFRSDVYALCSTMYHALAGEPPFASKTCNTAELAEIKKSIPPLKTVAPWLSDSICTVIDKGMKFKPDERFDSYSEFLEAVQFAEDNIGVEGASLPAPKSTESEQTTEQTAKLSLWLPVVAGLIVLALGGAALLYFTPKAQKQNDPVSSSIAQEQPTGIIQIDTALKEQIETGYSKALSDLTKGDYSQSSRELNDLMNLKNHPEPSASLAGLHNIAVTLLSGEPAQARSVAKQLANHANQAIFKTNSPLKKEEILHLVQQIISISPLDNNQVGLKNSPEAKAIISFITAIKNAESGDWSLAKEQFKKIQEADYNHSPRHVGFFEIYQRESSKYLSDFDTLKHHQEIKINDIKSKSDAEELKANLAQLHFQSNLKRNRFLVSTYRKKYNRIIRYYNRLEKAIPDKTTPQPSKPSFASIKNKLNNNLKSRNYSKVIRTLSATTFDFKEEREKKEQLLYLCKNANRYISHFSSLPLKKVIKKTIQDTAGNQYNTLRVHSTGAEVLKNEQITIIHWKDIDPASLLLLHSELTNDLSDSEKNKILEHAIAYAYLNDLPEMVEKAVKVLSQKDANFGEKWSHCMITLSH